MSEVEEKKATTKVVMTKGKYLTLEGEKEYWYPKTVKVSNGRRGRKPQPNKASLKKKLPSLTEEQCKEILEFLDVDTELSEETEEAD